MAVEKVEHETLKPLSGVVDDFKKKGKFSLSSADFAAFQQEENAAKVEDNPVEESAKVITKEDGSVIVEEDTTNSNDILFSNINTSNDEVQKRLTQNLDEKELNKPITITQQDKNNFLEAIISGDRYIEKTSIYNNAITVVFRSRKLKETTAIFSKLGKDYTDKVIATDMEYGDRLRLYLLACQLAEYRDMSFEPMDTQLTSSINPETKEVKEPGWLATVEYLDALDSSILVALYNELVKFEKKYWTMVNNASDQNFWNPVNVT